MRARRLEKYEQTTSIDSAQNEQTTTTNIKKSPKNKKQINFFSCLIVLISTLCYLFYQSAIQSFEQKQNILYDTAPPHRASKTITKKEEISSNNIKSNLKEFSEMKDKMYHEFYKRYGGKENAMYLYKNGLYTFDAKKSIEYTATRILSSIKSSKFNLSFGGYSVTVGRGNYFHQSYPFILENILSPIFEKVNVAFKVHNGAIGGTPSFPYGWCLRNFLGVENDFISWDFSMNEGRSAMGLEAYLRQGIVMFGNPMVMLLDNFKSGGGKVRRELVQKYVDLGVLTDVVIVNPDFSYVPKELMKEEGLRDWDAFGAPEGAPGKNSWHLTYQKHELVGWLLSVYFMQSLEIALDYLFKPQKYNMAMQITQSRRDNYGILPPPMTISPTDEHALTSLFGRPSPSNSSQYMMNRITCLSSYNPLLHNDIETSIISGLAQNASSSILDDTSQKIYLEAKGWMHDVGKLERDTKKKLIKFDQLGYIDLKAAYYGIPESGTLKLSISLDVDENAAKTELLKNKFQIENHAKTFVKSVILCQVNEKRTEKECDLEKNLNVVIGDAPALSTTPIPPSKLKTLRFPGALYLNKPLCVVADIHDEAEIYVNKKLKVGWKQASDLMLLKRGSLSMDISVVGDNVSYDNGACSISHIVLEMDSTIYPLQY